MIEISYYDPQYRKNLSNTGDVSWSDSEYNNYHRHTDYWEFWLVTKGECKHTLNNIESILYKSDGVLVRPNDAHKGIRNKDNPFSHVMVCITDEFVKKYCDFISPSVYNDLLNKDNLSLHLSPSDHQVILDYTVKLLNQKANSHYDEIQINSLCTYIINLAIQSLLHTETDNYPEWLQKLIYDINKPKNMGVFARDIVKDYHYSYQYIERKFKEYTGKTLLSYMNSVKMAQAQTLLSENRSCLEISNMLGYTSLSHFNHLYKRTFGYPPKQRNNK